MKKLVIIGFVLLLCASTSAVLMDTFVVERRYASVNNSLDGNSSSVVTGTKVSLKTYREHNTTIYVANILLGPGQVIQSALADSTYGKNVTEPTSVMAESVHAILATNGDYYGARPNGYVIRNGELLRSTKASDDQEDLVLWANGAMSVIAEGDFSAQELHDKGALQVLSFGPGLVIDSKISVTAIDEVAKAKASNPRTAIGYIGKGHYILVVSDGRTRQSEGLSLLELADFMKKHGSTEAYNLDGGGSSTMYYKGKIVNRPTADGNTITQRKVSDILYVK
jgi:exopolysaccharide biosynthesis protein